MATDGESAAGWPLPFCGARVHQSGTEGSKATVGLGERKKSLPSTGISFDRDVLDIHRAVGLRGGT